MDVNWVTDVVVPAGAAVIGAGVSAWASVRGLRSERVTNLIAAAAVRGDNDAAVRGQIISAATLLASADGYAAGYAILSPMVDDPLTGDQLRMVRKIMDDVAGPTTP
jgi:hypothetical protein